MQLLVQHVKQNQLVGVECQKQLIYITSYAKHHSTFLHVRQHPFNPALTNVDHRQILAVGKNKHKSVVFEMH